jgi:Ca2+-binding EF-hand superfamily protein
VLTCLYVQTIFLWTLVARQISSTLGKQTAGGDAEPLESHTNKEEPADGSISEEQAAMIQEVFKLFDTDGRGKLSEVGLASAIFSMGFSTHSHHQMAKSLLSQFSEDGTLSLQQFTELMRGQIAGQDPVEEIRSTFVWLCGDYPRVKTICFDRLKSRVRKLHIKLPDEDIQDMINGADRDEDGLVDLPEYMHILKNSTWV